jgi:hypothetical protein
VVRAAAIAARLTTSAPTAHHIEGTSAQHRWPGGESRLEIESATYSNDSRSSGLAGSPMSDLITLFVPVMSRRKSFAGHLRDRLPGLAH